MCEVRVGGQRVGDVNPAVPRRLRNAQQPLGDGVGGGAGGDLLADKEEVHTKQDTTRKTVRVNVHTHRPQIGLDAMP